MSPFIKGPQANRKDIWILTEIERFTVQTDTWLVLGCIYSVMGFPTLHGSLQWLKGCISDSRPKHKWSHSSDLSSWSPPDQCLLWFGVVGSTVCYCVWSRSTGCPTETCFFDVLLMGRAASGSGGQIRWTWSFMFRPRIADTTFKLLRLCVSVCVWTTVGLSSLTWLGMIELQGWVGLHTCCR